jgi:type I restriction enzyme R subunit
VLSEATNVFVMVDEAHRTQYKGLATNMRAALPHACFLGFTGTPIDKKDKSTLQTFGPYIDTYTIEQAVADGATVPIFYEGRLPELRVIGQTLDQLFDRVFAQYSAEDRQAIKQRYGNDRAIAAASKRIEVIVLDLLDHYQRYIQPNGFKAQVVAVDRQTAAAYFDAIQRLNGPECALIISGGHNDPLAAYVLERDKQAVLIERFKDPSDRLCILVVCDMLLTGFDAPVEQVMYLDSPLSEHTLLQAIARVNRTMDKKDYGLVIDYWGVSEDLQAALQIFTSTDVKGALTPKADELPRLQTRHAATLRFFRKLADKGDLHACVDALAAEDVRAEFDLAFRRFSESMDMLLPDTRAKPYLDDLRWLGKVRQAARARYHDAKLDLSECGAKVKKLIEDAIVADGVQVLIKEVALFSAEFDEKLAALETPAAKASEMEHAIRHEIHVRLEENPAFYESLRARLQKIIDDHKAQRITAAEQLKLFQELRKSLGLPTASSTMRSGSWHRCSRSSSSLRSRSSTGRGRTTSSGRCESASSGSSVLRDTRTRRSSRWQRASWISSSAGGLGD